MKREDVKNKIPGITDEQLNWIMQETAQTSTGRSLPPRPCRPSWTTQTPSSRPRRTA